MKREELSRSLHRQMEGVQVSPQLRRQTLDAAQGKEGRPIMKRKLSAALVAALIIVALSAVALAAAGRAGMLDFLARYQGNYIPDNASNFIESDVATLEEGALTVRVRELYYDGRTARMTVDVTPKDAKTLLLGTDCSMLDGWQNLAQPLDGSWNAADTRTVLDVYRAGSYTSAYRINLWTSETAAGSADSAMDYTLGEDGTLTVYLEQSYDSDLPERDIALVVDAIPFADPEGDTLDFDARQTISQQLTMAAARAQPTAQAQAEVYVSTEPIVYESIGVRVDSVRIEVKPLELYAAIEYTVIDRALYAQTDDGLWFEFIDPDSTADAPYEQRLTGGLSLSGTSHPTDGDLQTATHFIQEETLGKNELHSSYTLRAFECWDKQRYDTHTFEMIPAP